MTGSIADLYTEASQQAAEDARIWRAQCRQANDCLSQALTKPTPEQRLAATEICLAMPGALQALAKAELSGKLDAVKPRQTRIKPLQLNAHNHRLSPRAPAATNGSALHHELHFPM